MNNIRENNLIQMSVMLWVAEDSQHDNKIILINISPHSQPGEMENRTKDERGREADIAL